MSVTSAPTLDVVVTIRETWQCQTAGRRLADVVLAVDVTGSDDGGEEQKLRGEFGDDGVLLERLDAENTDPCVLTVSCGRAAVGRLMIVSEARTMEVYLPSGEYCATVRGEKQEHIQQGDRGPFYRKQLSLDAAPSSCDVKLLSLSSGSSVMVRTLVVGLRPAAPSRPEESAIDLQRVQSLVDEIGAGLSPGARNLMDMVRLQQKNQNSFLPLLMGGGFLSALARAPNVGSAFAAQPESDSVAPGNRAASAEMLCDFLKGRRDGVGSAPPEVLRELCGQVTRLRLDRETMPPIAATASMERRLEEMERRLKEHMDRRLDALELKLERALLAILPQGASSGLPPEEPANGNRTREAASL
ncbi:ATPase PAAT isoform X3 [Corythoichthys intestinalis]|uniref:ATPase PAAT isoform X2 n=1 Tax=Corythoichthys intestinalis TaxID=161448 RepID=UPI0025A55D5C|nr:ATPase PAAT isoform X2 [Corythoichthys intestinalis]XP_057682142.1 ATPase PAAT isoform X3 [Corythoichthys intestinalis]XP_061807792.1 ATPase PAAT-like [Nerophis lumbriciformis]